MTEPSQLQRIQSGDLFAEDFAVQCGAKRRGRYCTNPAAWYAQVHKPNCCRHPALNSAGNLDLLVCHYHLNQLEKLADREVKRFKPGWLNWLRADTGRCRSCRRIIQTQSDVLQVVRTI
jgi:hypothetical protein